MSLVRDSGFSPDIYGLKLFILEITAEAVSYGASIPYAYTHIFISHHDFRRIPHSRDDLDIHPSVRRPYLVWIDRRLLVRRKRGLCESPARQALLGIMLTILLGATLHLGLHLPFIILQIPNLAADRVASTPLLKKLDLAQTSLRRLIVSNSCAAISH